MAKMAAHASPQTLSAVLEPSQPSHHAQATSSGPLPLSLAAPLSISPPSDLNLRPCSSPEAPAIASLQKALVQGQCLLSTPVLRLYLRAMPYQTAT